MVSYHFFHELDNHNTKTAPPEDSTLGYHGNNPQYVDPHPSTGRYESLKWPEEGSGSANYGASHTYDYLTVSDPTYQNVN